MANQTVTAKGAPMSLADVREAIKSGAFSMEELMSSLAGEKTYARAGGAYRELISDGVSVVGGRFATCFRLGKKINGDGSEAPIRSRKKKSE